MSRVLVTGGLGYIGSHTSVELAAAGWDVVILDNLSNSKLAALERIRSLGGRGIEFLRADLRSPADLADAFSSHRCDAVVHFAGLKAVGESVAKPALYYANNVDGTRNLVSAMARFSVPRLVFSSSATVYGEPEFLPITETHPVRPQSPYGENKLEIERILAAEAEADSGFTFAALRYFNPIGAHPSGLIGEDPREVPNNLGPYISQVASGRREKLRIFGNDYNTRDGTGVRDYIHVMDLAAAHVAALDYLMAGHRPITANLGTGRGYSVLEMVRAFEAAAGRPIPFEFHPRRPGDVAEYYADAGLAERQLRWSAKAGIDEMCRDAWRWQSGNPGGYSD